MSVWTHVAAVFRIDGVNEEYRGAIVNGRYRIEWDKVVGRQIYDGDWMTNDDYELKRMEEDWAAYRKHPKRFMPTGSEGSLQRLVWVNPNAYSAVRYTVTVFGDLRDYDNADAIKEWFESVCDKCSIRQAVCCVTNGYETHTWERCWSH